MSETQQDCEAHVWRPYDDEEMKTLRSQAKTGRPSGAWLEAAEQCERCGSVEAKVSWWGQIHRVPVTAREGGQPAIQWPTRAQSPGAGMG